MKFPTIFGNPADRVSVFNKCGKKIAYYLKNTKIKPNHVTLFRQPLSIVLYFLLYKAEYQYFIIAGILCEFHYLLDCVDGQLARLNKMETKFGYWLEMKVDLLLFSDFSLFGFFLSLAIYKIENNPIIWLVLFFNTFGFLFKEIFLDAYINLKNRSRKDIVIQDKKRSKFSKLIFKIFIWYPQFIYFCMIFYEPLYSYLKINPLLIAMIVIAVFRQIQWLRYASLTVLHFKEQRYT